MGVAMIALACCACLGLTMGCVVMAQHLCVIRALPAARHGGCHSGHRGVPPHVVAVMGGLLPARLQGTPTPFPCLDRGRSGVSLFC